MIDWYLYQSLIDCDLPRLAINFRNDLQIHIKKLEYKW